jgi:hypothetical protein
MHSADAADFLNHLSPELIAFLREQVSTLVQWDIVRFFHDNPHMSETAAHIAEYMGRDEATVAPELHALAQTGVLQTHVVSDVVIYHLVDDPHIHALIADFIVACDDPAFRRQAVYHFITAS